MNTDQWFLEIPLNVAERYWIQAIWSVNRVHFCFARGIVSERELLGARRPKGTLVSWATSLRAQMARFKQCVISNNATAP
jgi:hypothetical protein